MADSEAAAQQSERHDGSATTPAQQGIKGILHPEVQADQPLDANQQPASDEEPTAEQPDR
jgi:hypothetical protein